MSNPLAIKAVTITLRNLLQQGFNANGGGGVQVRNRPLDKINNINNEDIVNLFLYHTQINPAWRNQDIPGKVGSGDASRVPLPLNLYYLLTVYDRDDDLSDPDSHRLLGQAMSVFHDNAILSSQEIQSVLSFNDYDLQDQLERVKITLQPLSLDEMSKLWTTFQTQYRISVAYEVSVVLIESQLAKRSSLPVLSRGNEDRGVDTLVALPPTLLGVNFPKRKPAAELGDTLIIAGEQLSSYPVTVRLRHPLLAEAIVVTPIEIRPAEIKVKLPSSTDDPQVSSQWLTGFYTLSLLVQRPNLPAWTTNEISLGLSPQITITAPSATTPGAIPEAPQGDVTISLTCIPQVRPQQRVVLLFGDREVAVQPFTAPTETLNFLVEQASPGTYVLRLRVDGVDSIPVDFNFSPPQFANNQKVKINE